MTTKSRALCLLLVVVCLTTFSTNAFALDKRLRLLFKTAGYGAGAGLVLGAASTAMGFGGLRNVLMGTSAGLYAGIALAGYIILTPSDRSRGGGRGRNPYAPKKPVGPDDPDDDDDQIQEMVPNRDQPQSSLGGSSLQANFDAGRPAIRVVRNETGFWLPVVGLAF